MNSKLRFLVDAMAALKTVVPIGGIEWADKYYYLTPESSNFHLKWETIAYQKAMLKALVSDDIYKVVVQKSARTGYTQLMAIATAYLISLKSRSVICYQPTETDAKNWMLQFVDPMIRECTPLRDVSPWFGKRDSRNTVSEKIFSNQRTLSVLGATSPRNFRSRTVDAVFLDEIAGMPRNVGSNADKMEGSPLKLAEKRTEVSPFAKVVIGSTPAEAPDVVCEEFEKSDTRFTRHLQCNECSGFSPLEWSRFQWDEGKPETVHTSCLHCGIVWKYSDLARMDDQGRWTDSDGNWIDDDCEFLTMKDCDGYIVTTPRNVGFFVWTAYSRFTDWRRMAEEYDKIKDDPISKQSFQNTWLGEAWDFEGEALKSEKLAELRHTMPTDSFSGQLLFVGADVQGNRIEASWVSFSYDGKADIIKHEIFWGDTRDHGEGSCWHQFDGALKTKMKSPNGREFLPDRVFVDSGFRSDEVHAFTRGKHDRGIFSIKGIDRFSGNICTKPYHTKTGKHKGYTVVSVLASAAKLSAYYLLSDPNKTVRINTGPNMDEHFISQLCAEKLIKTRDRYGNEKMAWKNEGKKCKRSGRGTNEATDTFAYAVAAKYSLEPIDWGQLKKMRG